MANTFRQRDLKRAASDVTADLHDIISSAEDFLRATASYGGAEIEAARGKMKQRLDEARRHMRPSARDTMDCCVDALQRSGRYAAEHKWETIGIVAAIGVLIGGWLAMSSRDQD